MSSLRGVLHLDLLRAAEVRRQLPALVVALVAAHRVVHLVVDGALFAKFAKIIDVRPFSAGDSRC